MSTFKQWTIREGFFMKKHIQNALSRANSAMRRILGDLSSKQGAGLLEYAIIGLLAVVLGAVFLTGFRDLFTNVIIPQITTQITNLFAP